MVEEEKDLIGLKEVREKCKGESLNVVSFRRCIAILEPHTSFMLSSNISHGTSHLIFVLLHLFR